MIGKPHIVIAAIAGVFLPWMPATLGAVEPDPAAERRVLHFPQDHCLGRVRLWRTPAEDALPIHRRRADLDVKLAFAGLAQGDVVVPTDRRVDVAIWAAQDLDLSCLSRFRPDDLYALSVGSPRLTPRAAQRIALESVRHLNHLQVLSMSGTGIMEQVLAVLQPMRSLRGLALNVTPTRGTPSLAGLPELPSLEWFDCDVGATDAELEHLARLRNLRILRLRLTRIQGPGLAALAKLPNLEHLCLWGETGPTDRHARYLESLTRIKRLTLWGGPGMTSNTLKSIGKLTGLEELTLIHTPGLADDGAHYLEPLRNLRRVEFDGDFGDEAIRVMSRLPRLEGLFGLTIGPEGTRLLGQMKGLKALELRYQSPQRGGPAGAGLHHLAGLHALEELEIAAAQVKDEDLRHLESLSNLKDLTVQAHDVTNAGIASICRLKRLESLTLYMVRVTKGGLNQLNGLPNLKSLVVKTHPQMTGGDDATLNLSGLTGLEKLSLLNCYFGLRDEDLAFLPALTKLERLNLAVAKSRSVWGAGLPGMTELERRGLAVLHKPMSSKVLRHIGTLTQLSYLRLPMMEFSKDDDFSDLRSLGNLGTLDLKGRMPEAVLYHLDGLPPSVIVLRIRTTEPVSRRTIYHLRQSLPNLFGLDIQRIGPDNPPLTRPIRNAR